MADPGYFLNWPLFMQSGMAQTPPGTGLTPPDWNSIEQIFSAPNQGLGAGSLSPGQLALTAAGAIPGAAIPRMISAAPKLAAALGVGTALGLGTSEAGGPEFKWNDPNTDRTKRLEAIDAELKKQASTVTRSAPGTQKALMDSLNSEKAQLLNARGMEYNEAFARHQAAESARIEAERPFREQYPTAYRTLPLAGWGLSALGGMLGARGGAPLRSAVGGALGGIPGSTAAAVAPTAYDAATLPTGSKYQQQAYEWLRSPDYWLGRVAPEVLTGMGIGATAGKLTSQVLPGPRSAPAMPQIAPQSQSLPALSGTMPAAPSVPPVRIGNVWRDPTTGRFASPPRVLGID